MPKKIFDRAPKNRQRVDAETLAALKGEGAARYSYDRANPLGVLMDLGPKFLSALKILVRQTDSSSARDALKKFDDVLNDIRGVEYEQMRSLLGSDPEDS